MARYANKTCNTCGIIKPAPEMTRVIKTHTNVIKNTVTSRDVIGHLAGSKTSTKSLEKAIFSGGGRKSTRKTEVWSCYDCAGIESPEQRERREEERALIADLKKKAQKSAINQRKIGKITLEKINNLALLIKNDKNISHGDQAILCKKIKEFIFSFESAKNQLQNLVVEDVNGKIEVGIDDEYSENYEFLDPKIMKLNASRLYLLRTVLFFLGFYIIIIGLSPAYVPNAKEDELGPYFLVASIAWTAFIWSGIPKLHNAVKYQLKENSRIYFDLLRTCEKDLMNDLKKSQETVKRSIMKVDNTEKDLLELKKRLNALIKLEHSLDISIVILLIRLSYSDGYRHHKEITYISDTFNLDKKSINLAKEIASIEGAEKVILNLVYRLTRDNPDKRKLVIAYLIDLASVDSKISEDEETLIKYYAKYLDVPLNGISRKINDKKRTLKSIVVDESVEDLFESNIIDEIFE